MRQNLWRYFAFNYFFRYHPVIFSNRFPNSINKMLLHHILQKRLIHTSEANILIKASTTFQHQEKITRLLTPILVNLLFSSKSALAINYCYIYALLRIFVSRCISIIVRYFVFQIGGTNHLDELVSIYLDILSLKYNENVRDQTIP